MLGRLAGSRDSSNLAPLVFAAASKEYLALSDISVAVKAHKNHFPRFCSGKAKKGNVEDDFLIMDDLEFMIFSTSLGPSWALDSGDMIFNLCT